MQRVWIGRRPISVLVGTMIFMVLLQVPHSMGLVVMSNHHHHIGVKPCLSKQGYLLPKNRNNNIYAQQSCTLFHHYQQYYDGEEEEKKEDDDKYVGISTYRRNNSNSISSSSSSSSRRSFLSVTMGCLCLSQNGSIVSAAEESSSSTDSNDFVNPNIPASPEEKSGLVVLRVAEVAQFQEKILKAVAGGEIEDVVISPQQIAFGTQIMMRNSNLDGNMKLMIYDEIPKRNRKYAIEKAVNAMNTLQNIVTTAARIDHPLTTDEMYSLADLYRYARLELNEMYELLAPKEKEKYYGYFMKVTEYEKKIAEGTYNPELDGILKFDD